MLRDCGDFAVSLYAQLDHGRGRPDPASERAAWSGTDDGSWFDHRSRTLAFGRQHQQSNPVHRVEDPAVPRGRIRYLESSGAECAKFEHYRCERQQLWADPWQDESPPNVASPTSIYILSNYSDHFDNVMKHKDT